MTLTVFDIRGCEVSVLVNERRNAGVYEVKFDGSNPASGVYFYRLQAGEFVAKKRLLVLKSDLWLDLGVSKPPGVLEPSLQLVSHLPVDSRRENLLISSEE